MAEERQFVVYRDCQYDQHNFCQVHGCSRRPCRMEQLRKLLNEKEKK